MAAPTITSAAGKRHKQVHRVGGKVHRAWPYRGKAPRSALARWLARQVGPTKVKPCERRVKGKLVRCHRAKPPRRGTLPPQLRRNLGIAADLPPLGPLASVASVPTGSSTLQLARSYLIPTDDPSYTRLLNWSWTYDSALTAMAFSVAGLQSEAQQLLDQLAALQHTDGSIEEAFNVADGTTEPIFRSGVIATVGIAGSLYDQDFGTSRYLSMAERAASYLLSLQGTAGLIRGGPDVTWYSTQHNLLAYAFLRLLGNELTANGNRSSANSYYTAANQVSSGIESQLLVHNASNVYFIEGLGDSIQSLDADALGAMYLQDHGETNNAQNVLAYAQSTFALTGRSIVKSRDPATYNETYSTAGPLSGFAPYLGPDAPNVVWTEGTSELLVAAADLGQPTSALASSLSGLASVTPGEAPVMADQTLYSGAYDEEYHVWPSAAGGAWMLIALDKPTFNLFR
ncbi:MAG TPA: hypothetical protein VFH80_16965 [Solirubrobacteraceae bacterium]|nr:hypothetical protein [Solirubrobacteraceae bacterium]